MKGRPKLSLASNLVQDNIPALVDACPRLYIGSIHAAFNAESLREFGITHILNASGIPPTYPKEFNYLTIDLRDKSSSNMLGCIPAANIFIEAALDQGGGVLVHCAGGRSRSAAFAMAFLMSAQQMSFVEAYESMKQARNLVEVNHGFQLQLMAYAATQCNVHTAHQLILHKRLERFTSKVNQEREARSLQAASQEKSESGLSTMAERREAILSVLDRKKSAEAQQQKMRIRLSRPGTGSVQIIPPLRSLERPVCCRTCGGILFTHGNVIRLDIDPSILNVEAWVTGILASRRRATPTEDPQMSPSTRPHKIQSMGPPPELDMPGAALTSASSSIPPIMPATTKRMHPHSPAGNLQISPRGSMPPIRNGPQLSPNAMETDTEPSPPVVSSLARPRSMIDLRDSPGHSTLPPITIPVPHRPSSASAFGRREHSTMSSLKVPRRESEREAMPDGHHSHHHHHQQHRTMLSPRTQSQQMNISPPLSPASTARRHSQQSSQSSQPQHPCSSGGSTPRLVLPPPKRGHHRSQSMEKRQWLERLTALEHVHSHEATPRRNTRNRIAQLAAEDEEAQASLRSQRASESLFGSRAEEEVRAHDSAEEVYYLEYLEEWMGDLSQADRGPLCCPQCSQEIGRYAWEGTPGTSAWRRPLLAVQRSRVQSMAVDASGELSPRAAAAEPQQPPMLLVSMSASDRPQPLSVETGGPVEEAQGSQAPIVQGSWDLPVSS